MGAMTPPSRKSCYNFRVVEINRVVDGDTIDVTIDLGFDLFKISGAFLWRVYTSNSNSFFLKKIESKINSDINSVSINYPVDLDHSEVVTTLPTWGCHRSHVLVPQMQVS